MEKEILKEFDHEGYHCIVEKEGRVLSGYITPSPFQAKRMICCMCNVPKDEADLPKRIELCEKAIEKTIELVRKYLKEKRADNDS